jgi:hypothetical protein
MRPGVRRLRQTVARLSRIQIEAVSCVPPAMPPATWTRSADQRHTRHMAEGQQFRRSRPATAPLTRLVGVFQDRRTRPLCEPSRRSKLPYLLASGVGVPIA